MTHSSTSTTSDVVGLVPAAGHGRRLGPLPCSKEIYPITVEEEAGERPRRVKVASEYLFLSMQEAGVNNVYVVLRDGKWDIPAYWGDGYRVGLNIAYLMMKASDGTPFTLDQAYPFLQDARVAMGFPDVLFAPTSAYRQLLERQEERQSDLVLGLFPASHPEKVDMVELGPNGRPVRLDIKPETTDLTYSWVCAVWAPSFTQYLHDQVRAAPARWEDNGSEVYVGHIIETALQDGLQVDAVRFPEGRYIDIGTPAELEQAVRREWSEMSSSY